MGRGTGESLATGVSCVGNKQFTFAGNPTHQGRQVLLRAHGIDEAQAAELRARLAPFAEDWNSPEMAAYDHYDAAKPKR